MEILKKKCTHFLERKKRHFRKLPDNWAQKHKTVTDCAPNQFTPL